MIKGFRYHHIRLRGAIAPVQFKTRAAKSVTTRLKNQQGYPEKVPKINIKNTRTMPLDHMKSNINTAPTERFQKKKVETERAEVPSGNVCGIFGVFGTGTTNL